MGVDGKMRVGVALSLLVIAALLVGGLAAIVYQPPMLGMGMMQGGMMSGDYEWYYSLKTGLSTFNIALIVALLAIYINIYLEVRSEFTLGLMIFSIVLLLYALTSNPMLHRMWGFHGSGFGPFAMLPDLFVSVALITLLYLSLK